MSACSFCSKITHPELTKSTHQAINLINKLNSFTVTQLKLVNLSFIRDQILVAQLDILLNHEGSAETVFTKFGDNVKHINPKALNYLLNWVPQQWNAETNKTFMDIVDKSRSLKRFWMIG